MDVQSADLEQDVAVGEDCASVDRLGAGVLVCLVGELGLQACSLFDEDAREAFLEQKLDVCRGHGDTTLARVALLGDANGQGLVGSSSRRRRGGDVFIMGVRGNRRVAGDSNWGRRASIVAEGQGSRGGRHSG